MNTTTITIKTDPIVKSHAQKISKLMGLSLSDVINVMLRNFIREKKLVSQPLDFEEELNLISEEFTLELKRRASVSDKTKEFTSVQDFIRDINSTN